MMEVLILAAVLVLSLIMIPFGMPGTLVMFAAALCYKLLVPQGGIGWTSVVVVGILMAIAEGLEWTLAARFAKKYGGSRRAGWGAGIGGVGGGVMGGSVPLFGSGCGGVRRHGRSYPNCRLDRWCVRRCVRWRARVRDESRERRRDGNEGGLGRAHR